MTPNELLLYISSLIVGLSFMLDMIALIDLLKKISPPKEKFVWHLVAIVPGHRMKTLYFALGTSQKCRKKFDS